MLIARSRFMKAPLSKGGAEASARTSRDLRDARANYNKRTASPFATGAGERVSVCQPEWCESGAAIRRHGARIVPDHEAF
jgi:hypothetical protein